MYYSDVGRARQPAVPKLERAQARIPRLSQATHRLRSFPLYLIACVVSPSRAMMRSSSRPSISQRRESSTTLLMHPTAANGNAMGENGVRRTSQYRQSFNAAFKPIKRHRNRFKCLTIIACVTASFIVIILEYTQNTSQTRLSEPLLTSFQRLQTKLAESARLISSGQCNPSSFPLGSTDPVAHWNEGAVQPETEERLQAENQPLLNAELVKSIEKGWKLHQDDMASELSVGNHYPEPIVPPPKGYGALSRSDNPWRERFLVPTYACNEQETGSQMHVRQLLHLAKALNRTLVLPNWGFGIPTISNCRPYAFDTIYETESTNSIGLWSVPYRKWADYVRRRGTQFNARISVIFFRDTHKVLSESIATTDRGILEEACVDPDPFKITDPPLYVATTQDTTLSHMVRHLKETDQLSTLFVIFNHYSDIRIVDGKPFPDPLLQERPKEWGLWVGAPWPQWNYSTSVVGMFQAAQSRLPTRYAALQWRMELMPPKVLLKCSDEFAESVIQGMRARALETIYVASDMPLTNDRKTSKSASFNAPEVAQAKEAIDHLVFRLKEAAFSVKTWNDVKPKPGDPHSIDGLAEGASGIFDKLILGDAEHLWAANPHCAFKSSFLGSIQTLRQDKIGDPKETDWDKLGVSWIGAPITERFWWHLKTEQL